MINADQKKETLEQIVNAYQSLNFYYELKEKNEHSKDFMQTVFSLNESMICTISKYFDLKSSIKDSKEEKNKETRNRNARIQQLEKEITENSDFTDFKKNITTVFDTIKKIWQNEGFSGFSNPHITHYGDLKINLSLQPIREIWDFDDEANSERNYKEILASYIDKFEQKQLSTVSEEDERYVYVIDNDSNEKIISQLLFSLFPGVCINNFDRRRHNDLFIITSVTITISNLAFLEGNNE